MTVEVVVPSLRQESVERLVWSLGRQSHLPDVISIVSNETQPWIAEGNVKVRLLRFTSSEYAIGEKDVALRQNVGIFAATGDTIIIQGDDQVAPPTMVEDALHTLGGRDYLWGNHRLIDFDDKAPDEIRNLPRVAGDSRERPVPPAWHGYQSCYGGMFVARTDFLRSIGAFDMAFNGLHAGEDQQLGYRLMRRAGQHLVYIEEPPFSWHSIELRDGNTRARYPWLEPLRNGCGPDHHDFADVFISEVRFIRCRACPALRFDDDPAKLFRDEVLIPFHPEAVTATSIWL